MDCLYSILHILTVLVSCYIVLSEQTKEEIRMPGIKPSTEDYYICTSIPVTEEKYITQYEAIAEASTAHHILLFGCDKPFRDTDTWECGSTCKGKDSIMFAWAKNAPPTTLPPDVGYHIGGNSGIKHIVMQVHYLRALTEDDEPDRSGIAFYTTTSVPKYTQGILLMVSGYGNLPPHKPVTTIDVSCHFNGQETIHPFAYRTHAHALSTVISAYKKPTIHDEWEMLGKGNPQWPQAFYPMNRTHEINHGDILVARCVYNTTGHDKATHIGSTHNDEMCNFYMMYYVEGEASYINCIGNRLPRLARYMPASSLERLPPNPLLDEMAAGHHHHVDEATPSPTSQPSFHVNVDGNDIPFLTEAEHWYTAPDNINIGQLAGLDTDSNGHLVIFHRGSHVWDASSFDRDEIYRKQDEGPIAAKALVRFDSSGIMIGSWGDNMFYLPHGITIDHEDNVWLTDVALHQVFKFPANETSAPSLTLGQEFTPDSTETAFCKPTDVAVAADGSFFVSDGYCNSRIIHFDAIGQVLNKWGSYGERAPNRFYVVHSLALSETTNVLCAADRENKRIQCFDTSGIFLYEHPCSVNPFALAFKPDTDKMIVAQANQAEDTGKLSLLHVFPTDASEMGDFKPKSKSFTALHDVSVSADGQSVYVAQLNPPYVYKFMVTIQDSQDGKIDTKNVVSGTHRNGGSVVHMPVNNEDDDNKLVASQTVPIVVGVLLLVPIVCVLLVLIIYKIYKARQRKDIHGAFDMGNIFGGSSSRGRPRGDMTGFTPLATNEDQYTDSEDEAINERKTFVKP